MKTLHALNTKSLRKSLKDSGIEVVKCHKGKGSSKNAVYISVTCRTAESAVKMLRNIGVVSATGKAHFLLSISDYDGVYSFGACYLSDEVFSEMNNKSKSIFEDSKWVKPVRTKRKSKNSLILS